MDALLKLEAWIESEKANYQRNKHTMTYAALSKEVDRQLFFLEIEAQIKRCQEEETQEFLNRDFPTKTLCEEIKHNAKENNSTGL